MAMVKGRDWRAVVCAVAAVGVTGSFARADSDTCSSAPLVAVPGVYAGNTVDATVDGSSNCAGCATRDVWIKFVPPATQYVHISLCHGAAWDTVLSLHTGCPGNSSNQVACNDDACSPRSDIRRLVNAGTTYYVRIAGWCGDFGNYAVSLEYVAGPNVGPDVIVGDITNTLRYTPSGDITAYSFGTTSCNIGTEDAEWVVSTPAHPLVHQSMFRLHNGRIEQLGQSWLKHTFGTIDNAICGVCNGHLGQVLGVGCSDPYVASQNGDRGLLGPKWEVNATTGVFPYPYTSPPYSGSIARRLQVLTSEIDPVQNPGAAYFVEIQYITADDAQAGNGLNNASYRRLNFATATSTPTTPGDVFRGEPAINAWKAADPSVTQVNADYVEQGLTARFIVAAKARSVGGGEWEYEYAVRNLNSHRSGQAFAVPFPEGQSPTMVGFRDVPYHSGDGIGSVNYSGTDWVNSNVDGWLVWSTQTHAQNPNGNALRWGTQYNFRFRSNAEPTTGNARLVLFRPGAVGEENEVIVEGLPVPTVPEACRADFDENGTLEVPDIFAFLAAWFAEDPSAEFDGNGTLAVPDIFAFLAAWFAGCAG